MSALCQVGPTVIVLGAYGSFVGGYIAAESLSRGLPTKILVRPSYETSPEKKAKVPL
jgi:hypothetical protein